MIKIEPMIGDDIHKTAKQLVKAAQTSGGVATAIFNEITLTADPDTSPGDICQRYADECERRAKAYRESPEGKAAAQRDREDLAEKQTACDILMDRLLGNRTNEVEWSDLSSVLGWLHEFQPVSDRSGVVFPRHRIVDLFEQHGFLPNVNLDDEFDRDDRDNFGRYIIGQALDGLGRVGAIHPMVGMFVDQWRAKFEGGTQ